MSVFELSGVYCTVFKSELGFSWVIFKFVVRFIAKYEYGFKLSQGLK